MSTSSNYIPLQYIPSNPHWAVCRWRVAKPDEWLLVLRDGRLIGQGIGLRAFCGCPEATGGW